MKFRALLCLSVFVVSIVFTTLAQAAPQMPVRRGNYSGEDIFRGLFLGQGPVAQLFPEVWANKDIKPYVEKLHSPKAVAGANALIGMLKRKDASFFARFKESMESGDPVRIDEALNEVSRLSREIADEQIEKAKKAAESRTPDVEHVITANDYVDDLPESDLAAVVLVALARLLVAIVDAVAVVQVVAVVELYKLAIVTDNYAFLNNTAAINNNYYVLRYDTMSQGLGKDSWVAQIAERLDRAAAE